MSTVSPKPSSTAKRRVDKFLLIIAATGLMSASAAAQSQDPGERAWALFDGGDPAAAEILLSGDAARLIHIRAAIDVSLDRDSNGDFSGAAADLYIGCRAVAAKDYQRAEPALDAALAGYSAAGDDNAVAVCRERLGAMLMEIGRTDDATAHLEAALAAGLPADGLSYASVQYNLGRARVRGRDIDAAATCFNAAIPIFRAFGAHALEGGAWLALSVVSRLQMDLDTTLERRTAALEAYTRAGDVAGQARCLHYIATIHSMRGDLTTGATLLHRAIASAREAGADDVLGGALGDLAGVNYLVGNFERALEQYREAGALVLDPRRKGWYLLNTASILAYQERHDEALEYCEEARVILEAAGDQRNLNVALYTAGLSYNELGDYERGLAKLDEAIAHAREWEMPVSEAYALNIKGDALLETGRLEEAAEVLAAASELARASGYFDIIEAADLGQAKVARNQGDLEKALEHMENALDQIARVRRLSGGSTSIQTGLVSQADRFYDEMIDLLFEMDQSYPDEGYDSRAFDVAQSARSRSFLDMLAETEVDLRIRSGDPYRERETAILDGIAALQQRLLASPDSSRILQPRIGELEGRLDILENELRQADPRYAEIRYPRPCDLAAAQAEVLGSGEMLLDFQLGKEHSHLWAVSRTAFHFVELPPRAEIEAQVRTLLPMLRDYNLLGENPGWLINTAFSLYRTLLGPVADEIRDASHLLIVPDGLLHYLPFEALVSRSGGGSFAELHYLIADWNIAYAPGLSVLRTLREDDASAPDPLNSLLVGDPIQPAADQASVLSLVAGAADLVPVPHGEREILRSAQLLGGADTRVLTGAEATVAGVRFAGAGPWNVVHFATHGLFNETRPEFSGLVLSPDPETGDDGFLATGAVFGLDLDCELAVLSACSSALGEHADGEGLTGLTRAFMYAGARGVVSSLWDVSGPGAAMFMETFYTQLRRGSSRDHALVLSQTKRQMIQSAGRTEDGLLTAHPAVWAAFVLNGGKYRPGS